MLKLNFLT